MYFSSILKFFFLFCLALEGVAAKAGKSSSSKSKSKSVAKSSGHKASAKSSVTGKSKAASKSRAPSKSSLKLKGPAKKGQTGVYHDKKAGNMKVYYGDRVKQHAAHVASSTKPGQKFTYAKTRQQHQDNRKAALKGIKTKTGKARDEKPPASFDYKGKASVKHLPAKESRVEGGMLSTLRGMIKAKDGKTYGSKTPIELIDNRSRKRDLQDNVLVGRSALQSALVEREAEEEEELGHGLIGRDAEIEALVQDLERRFELLSVDSYLDNFIRARSYLMV